MDAGRTYDSLGRPQPQKLTALTCFRAIPGLAGQFKREVPAAHIEQVHPHVRPGVVDLGATVDTVVRCTCGARTSIRDRVARITECAGGCCRFFLPTGDAVFVAGPYPADEAVAA